MQQLIDLELSIEQTAKSQGMSAAIQLSNSSPRYTSKGG